MEIHRLSSEDEYEAFVRERQYAVVLVDAPWDAGPGALIRPTFGRAARVFADRVSFGEINCDDLVRVARSLQLANVPAVAYYRSSRPIAVLIGAQQDVADRTQALLNGQRIGRDDGWDSEAEGKALHPPTESGRAAGG